MRVLGLASLGVAGEGGVVEGTSVCCHGSKSLLGAGDLNLKRPLYYPSNSCSFMIEFIIINQGLLTSKLSVIWMHQYVCMQRSRSRHCDSLLADLLCGTLETSLDIRNV